MRIDYDEVSPITGNKCVFVEPIDDANQVISKMCMESGFTTLNAYHSENPDFPEIEAKFPEISVVNKIVDKFGFHWYPSMINAGGVILLPEPLIGGSDPDGFIWVVGRIVAEEGGPGLLDRQNAAEFGSGDFELALDHFNKLLRGGTLMVEDEITMDRRELYQNAPR